MTSRADQVPTPCPRCGSINCSDPDSKACSDNCITRHLAEIAALRSEPKGAADDDEPADEVSDALVKEGRALATKLVGKPNWRIVADLTERVADLSFRCRAIKFLARKDAALSLPPKARAETFSDDDLRRMWLAAGGRFNGPNVETGHIPEANLFRFLRELSALPLAASPPKEQEPVAWWRWRLWLEDHWGMWHGGETKPLFAPTSQAEVEPLYAAPPAPSKVRPDWMRMKLQDAERVMQAIDATIQRGALDPRSAIADARLDFCEPFKSVFDKAPTEPSKVREGMPERLNEELIQCAIAAGPLRDNEIARITLQRVWTALRSALAAGGEK